ncbi:Calcineurin subunit B [Astathelohania contejeani]|uniref:Calcineurin subunit B n=1 Tax=Astathelohania contejeani TaxID=164912 RepID=A0ABQ7HZD5_9MICR|nr:Calcineurin subunit B [Thelohania contejeani]
MKDEDLVNDIEHLLKKGSKIKKSDLLVYPTISQNPIALRIIQNFTKKGRLDIEGMIKSLRMFVSSAPLDAKLKLLFRMYDTDNDGLISSGELFMVIKTISDDLLTDSKIQNIVDKTFYQFGEYVKSINFEEFCSLIKKRNINLETFFKCNSIN